MDEFLQNIDDYKAREERYLSSIRLVQEKYSLARLRLLDEPGFLEYVNALQQVLDITFGKSETTILEKMEGVHFPESAWLFVDVINTQDHNKEIRNNKLGNYVTGRIMGIYDSQYYIYSLPEKLVDYYLRKLKIEIPAHADLTEKHCLLYFWKQCNEEMDEWTPFIFTCFLESVFGNPYKEKAEDVVLQPVESLINQERLQRAMKWFFYL